MTGLPPSPPTPVSSPSIAPESGTVPGHVTTTQLATCLEDALGYRLDEATLEEFLVQLDRQEYVEWVAVNRTGDHVWDLSKSPDRIADAIAAAVGERVRAWLDGVDD